MTDVLQRLSAALVDRYRIERELGAGGMATVYLAHDHRHDRDVAIKVLHADLAATLGPERFLSEIRTMARLQHPHLLPLLDSGEADGLLFYVMPFLQGESLRDRLARERMLPVEEAVRIAREVADGLAYAHGHGIVHRDIKPENILLQSGHALVADFGIALAVQEAGGTRLTQTGLSLGTPQYMSPEQATGEKQIDQRTDVYALGAVTYEMLVGEPPFTGPTVQAIVARVLTEEPRGLRIQRPSIPAHVEAAVLRAVTKLPADRFATVQEFAQALVVPTTSGGIAPAEAPPGRRGGVDWTRWGPVAAALAVVGLGLAAWSLVGRSPATDASDVRRLLVSMPHEQPIVWAQGGDVALSADGRKAAYLSMLDGTRRLVVRDWGELTGTPVRGSDGAVTPFFAPSGKSVAYFTLAPDRLRVAPLDGGPSVVLVDSNVVARGGAWGEDGYLYYSNREGLARVRESGGTPEQVTTIDAAAGELAHVYPDVLPGGRAVLFTVRKGPASDYEVAAIVPGEAARRVIGKGVLARYAASGHLVVLRADTTLAAAPFDVRKLAESGPEVPILADVTMGGFGEADLSMSRSGQLLARVGNASPDSSQLVWVDRQGRVQAVDSTWMRPFTSPALSPDGKRLAVNIADDVWVKELPNGTPRRIVSGSAQGRPVFDRDGATLTYLSLPRPSNDLYRIPVSGGAPALVLDWSTNIWEGIWSSDGRWFVFRVGGQGSTEAGRDVYARQGSDTTTIPILTTPADEKAIQLSPDDRFLAYESNATGRNEVYVRPFPGSGAASWQVTTTGGREPHWSSKGTELFFRDATSGDMMVASIETTPEFRVAGVRRLFPASVGGGRLAIEDNFRGYDVSPDDSRFLMVLQRGATSTVGRSALASIGGVPQVGDLLLIDGWFTELRAKAGKQ